MKAGKREEGRGKREIRGFGGEALVVDGSTAWRRRPGWGVGEWVVLAVYGVVAAVAAPRHEAWGDEAQAWMLARGNSIWALFRYRLHYEGTPGLWHLLLRLLVDAHVPWGGVRWVCVAAACVGVWVWLRWTPMPAVVRWVVPLGFWMMYQYAVVARSYVLFPGLLFGVCALYRARRKDGKPRVIWFAVTAGLLGNLCLQGALVAGVLAVLYGWEVWRERVVPRRRMWVAAGVFAGFALVSGYTALPAPDVNFAVQGAVRDGALHRVLLRVVGETPRVGPAVAQAEALPGTSFPGRAAAGTWRERMAAEVKRSVVATALVEMASEALWPVATWNWVGVVFYGVVISWMWRRHGLRYLLPALLVWVVGEFLWSTDHHAGMLLLTVLAGVWLASLGAPGKMWVERGFVGVLAVVLGAQVVWAGAAVWQDWRGVYDPGAEVARFLRDEMEPRSQDRDLGHPASVAGFHFWTVAVQPYFAGNVFENQPLAYWQWSSNVTTDGDVAGVLRARPKVIVVGMERPLSGAMRNQILPLNMGCGEDEVVRDLEVGGYGVRRRFCGERFSRMSGSFEVCDVVLGVDNGNGKGVRKGR